MQRRCGEIHLVAACAVALADGASADAATDVPADAGGHDSSDGHDVDDGCRGISPPATEPDVALAAPLFVHPNPTGPFAVGTHLSWLTDASRDEPVTAAADDHRVVAVQFWYPTDVDEGPYGPLMQPGVDDVLEQIGGPDGFASQVETRSRYDVPLLETPDRLPIVIYSHGMATFRHENSPLMEDLASRGWFVVGVSHNYSSQATVLADGTVTGTQNVPSPPAWGNMPAWRAWTDDAGSLLADVWAPDIQFVLDELERLDGETCTWLSGRLDLERVGLTGYSFGGATAHHVCAIDERCDAAINMDGSHRGTTDTAHDRPLLFFKSLDAGHEHGWAAMLDHHDGDAFTIRMQDVNHGNFAMNGMMAEPFFGRAAGEIGFGAIDATRAFEIIRDYTAAFFDEYVLGQPASLLNAPSADYPEVWFERVEAGVAVGPPSIFGKFFLGWSDDRAARDGEVSAGDELIWTDIAGRWRLDDVAEGASVDVGFYHPEVISAVWRVTPGPRHQNVGTLFAPEPGEFEDLAESVGVALSDTAGHVVVDVSLLYREMEIGWPEGATITIDGYDAVYGDEGDDLDPDATSLRRAGWGVVLNVAPGRHVLDVTSPSSTCFAGISATGEDTNEVLVEAGTVTYAHFKCAE